MFIIYGYRSSHLASAQLERTTCPQCESKGTILMSAFGRYAHVFWLPLFTLGKHGAAQCQQCQTLWDGRSAMNKELKDELDMLKSTGRIPLWHFVGSLLIALCAGLGIYQSEQQEAEELAWIASPVAGDVYECKGDSGYFLLAKVESISNDTVWLVPNQYQTNTLTNMNEIDKAENYSPETKFGIIRSDLQQMYEEGKIVNVKRR